MEIDINTGTHHSSMLLENRIREIVEGNCDYLGIADLSPAKEAMMSQGGLDVDTYPRAISIGVALMDDIVDMLPHGRERWAAVTYRSHAYDFVNGRLDQMASRVASEIQRAGYRALPLPASIRIDDERICAMFSHKMAAHLAGLGWIGKSCLLVTPDRGPRARWVTVLTNAPVEPTGGPMDQRCGECMECVKACPASAFTGRNFIESEPREARYDARKCEAYFKSMEAEGRLAVCGMCIYACPCGKKRR
jgi:epoxyqueuosine reductase